MLCLVGLIGIGLAAIAFMIVSPPTNLIRDRVVAEVKSRTGRELLIGGKTRLTFIPSLGVSLTDVTLSAPLAMPGPPLLKADGLDMKVALLPLIIREVAVEQMHLRKPVIELRVDANGRRSWDFTDASGEGAAPRRLHYAQVNPRGADGRPVPKELQDFVKNASTPPGRSRLGVNSISLDDVRISDGTLRYVDERRGARRELSALDVHISAKEASGPLEVNGAFVYGGETINVVGHSTSLTDLLDERPSKVVVRLDAKPLELRYDGSATLGQAAALDGMIALRSPSLDGLGRLLQLPVAGIDGLGAMLLEGQLKLAGTSSAIMGLNLTLGETKAEGSLSLDTGGMRPLLKANLKLSALDLNQLSGQLGSSPAAMPQAPGGAPPLAPIAPASPAREGLAPATPPAPSSAPATSPPGPAKPQSIEELLRRSEAPANGRPRTAVAGFTRRSSDGWSSEVIDVALLRIIDIDGRFEIGRITAGDMKIGSSTSALLLKAGVLKLDVPQAELYGGKARGLVTVDAREQSLALGANISGDGLAAMPLLKDAAGLDLIEGKGRLLVAVSAKGGSERELIGTLAGKAELNLSNGALHGWDAGQMIAGLGQGRIPRPDRTPGAKTPFSLLSGSFQIQNGVARTQDLKLESPALTGTGSGVINLVDRNINLVVKPKPVAVGSVGGVEIPLRIAGPWDHVSVLVDAGGILKSQPAQEAVKKLKEGDVDGALEKVLGKGTTEEKIERGRGLLKQFLNNNR